VIKKLTKHGNSLALILDKPILELLGFDEKSPLMLFTDGKALIVARGGRKARDRRIEEILTDLNRRYGSVFRRLAES
jgi:hypothetical protein